MKQCRRAVKRLTVCILFCLCTSICACSINKAPGNLASIASVPASNAIENITPEPSANATGTEAFGGAPVATIPADFHYAFEGSHISLDKQPRNRRILDDFLEPSTWQSTDSLLQAPVSLSSTGSIVEAYRKYDSLLALETYLFLHINIKNLKNIEWVALYLMEDLSYSNYFECDLTSYLSEGSNLFSINKSDFSIGSGKPGWDKINIIKIGFGTFAKSTATITLREISTYSALPVCSIWFDDGWGTVYSEAFPIMREKKFSGILSVIGSHVGYPKYCSTVQLDELYSSGWDLVNHTYNHPDMTSLPLEEAETDIYLGYDYLYSRGYTKACANMVPPYCATNEAINTAISKYAMTSRVNPNQYNYLPIQDPYNIGFKEVTSAIGANTVRGWIDHAIENDLWLVLVFHSLDAPTDTSTKCVVPIFKQIVEYLDQKRSEIDVLPLSKLLDTDHVISGEPAQTVKLPQPGVSGSLLWEEDFNHREIDATIWNILNKPPSVNQELQTYRTDNVKVEDGYLQIISTKENTTYYSGAVTTESKQLFLYGRIEIKAKLASGQGIFPAFWLLPQSGEPLPEIDIMEYLGNEPNQIWHVFHYKGSEKQNCLFSTVKGEDFSKDFHVFTLQWSKDRLIWMVDGVETYSVTGNIPNDKMFLYLNTAIGGDWPGNPDQSTGFPLTMYIDYIKYYNL